MVIDLDWHLAQANQKGDRTLAATIADLRWELVQAAKHANWRKYNEVRDRLNEYGAHIPAVAVPPQPLPQEQMTMSMFDKPMYLTGKEGFVDAGDTFWLHNARFEGTVKIAGNDRDQVKLQVSREREGEKVIVFTAGAAIVNQIKRMDANDRAAMPLEVRLDQVPSNQGSPTNVLTPANQPEPSAAGSDTADF